MPPLAEAPTEPVSPEQATEGPQFQVNLSTTTGPYLIASSDTVNDLVDQAKYWLGSTDSGMQLNDGQVQSVTLQELDPQTGNYVDGQAVPVASKAEVVSAIRDMGAR